MGSEQEWNYGDVWEAIAETVPGSVAQVQGERRITWGELDRRADGVASALLAAGAARGDRVANYLVNAPEYLETFFAALKIGLVPVNTNYRYAADELTYLWNDSQAVAVAFHGTYTERVAEAFPDKREAIEDVGRIVAHSRYGWRPFETDEPKKLQLLLTLIAEPQSASSSRERN